LNLIF